MCRAFFSDPALCLRNPSLSHRPQSQDGTLLQRKPVTTSQQQAARPCPYEHGPWARPLLASCPAPLRSIRSCVGPRWLPHGRGHGQPSEGDSVPVPYRPVSASEDCNGCQERHRERQLSTLGKPWSPGARQHWSKPRVCVFPVM